MNTKNKILIAVTSNDRLGDTGKVTGYYLPEVSYPADVFLNAGYEIDLVSPLGGEAPMDPKSRDLDDSYNKKFLDNPRLAEKLLHTLTPEQVRTDDYAALFFAGGHGTMWDFADNVGLQRLAREIYEAGGVVSAVCHGPAALVNVKLSNGEYLVAGKDVSTFSNAEEAEVGATEIVPFLLESTMVERGARYSKADLFQPYVKVSERLVTGQNQASAKLVGEEIVKIIKLGKL